MEIEIIHYLKDVHPAWRSRRIVEKPEYVEFLNKKYPSYQLSHQIQFLFSGLESEPRCAHCGGPLKLPSKTTCSHACRVAYQANSADFYEKRQAKTRKTCLERYGNTGGGNQEKRLKTMVERYGAKVSPASRKAIRERSAEFVKKSRKSMMERYGVENPGQLPGHKEKVARTLNERHGVTHCSHLPHVKENMRARSVQNLQSLNSNVHITQIQEPDEHHKQCFKHANQIIQFECLLCNSTQHLPYETFKWRSKRLDTPCNDCVNLRNRSVPEIEITQFLEEHNVNVEHNTRRIIPPMELDFWLPDHNVAIEYNGLFWHSEDRVGKHYHIEKTERCAAAGIRLIHIFEDEWIHRKSAVLHRLKHMLDMNTQRIHARKTKIKEIPLVEARNFIEQYHTQGYVPSRIKLGLFHQDELVSVMTFSKPSKAKGQESKPGVWEISRAASKYSVIGGVGKLVKHFTRHYDVEELFSYSDRRWGDGKSYEFAGLCFDGNTRPNYWYIRGDKRIHRYALRKNSSDDPDLTEWENRQLQGWNRIWDCGNTKWVYKKNPA